MSDLLNYPTLTLFSRRMIHHEIQFALVSNLDSELLRHNSFFDSTRIRMQFVSDDGSRLGAGDQTGAPEDEWWQKRHEAKLNEKKQFKKIDLLLIGDSITHGWEGQKELWEKYFQPRNAFNIGYSGDRTEHVLWRLENGEIDGFEPQLIVIMIGTNNTGHRKDPPAQTAAGIRAIVDKLGEKLPQSKILLLGVFPRGATADDELRKINLGINEIIRDFQDGKRIYYQDIDQVFLDDRGNLPKEIMPDFLHPNAEGYRLWAEAIEPTLKQLMP